MKIIVLLVLALMSANAAALGPEKACFRMGKDEEDTCSVSLSTLIARGEDFNGKVVIVRGFFVYSERPMLFVSKEAFLLSDTVDGIDVKMPSDTVLAKRLAGFDPQSVVIKGRYHAIAGDVTKYGAYRTGGRLSEIVDVSTRPLMPWGYKTPPPYGMRTEKP